MSTPVNSPGNARGRQSPAMPDKTTMDGPVHLSPPELEPAPARGCATCAALAARREVARHSGDMSAVTDRNVEIRRHPHGKESR
ncbi:hypothetical protein SUDANB37_02886 [Streptomyces sp. enrichment culture]